MGQNHLDLFAEMAALIESAFESETAQARAKRDAGLEHLRALQAGWGATIGDPQVPHIERIQDGDPLPTREEGQTSDNDQGISFKAAMIQAIDVLPAPISRGRVLDWVLANYPKFKDTKEGTIASTFSRVKSDYLVPIEGNEKFVFRKKVENAGNGQSS